MRLHSLLLGFALSVFAFAADAQERPPYGP